MDFQSHYQGVVVRSGEVGLTCLRALQLSGYSRIKALICFFRASCKVLIHGVSGSLENFGKEEMNINLTLLTLVFRCSVLKAMPHVFVGLTDISDKKCDRTDIFVSPSPSSALQWAQPTSSTDRNILWKPAPPSQCHQQLFPHRGLQDGFVSVSVRLSDDVVPER